MEGIFPLRKQLVSGKKLLLFVDTGDNCRCPLAIGYLKKLLQQKNIDYVDLRHMGVMTPNDLLPTPEVVQLLKDEGVDISYHRSRPINDDLIRQADLVIGFTAIHVQTCYRRVPECKSKTFLLKEYVGLGHTGDQIHDPMGSTMEIFKKYFNEIKQSLQRLVEMEFITSPPEPKEVVIAPTVNKPRPLDDDDAELPAGYYDEEKLALKAEKAAKAKLRLKALMEESEAPEKPANAKADAGAKKEAKAASKAGAPKADKPAKAPREEPKPKAKPGRPAKTDGKAASAKADKAAAKPEKKTAAKAEKADAPKKAAKAPAAKAAKAKPEKTKPAKGSAADSKKSKK